jgi:DNA modification methylase
MPTTQQTLAIRRAPIESLHPDPANARLHGPENLDAIVGSLKRFGQAEPLIVQKATGRIIGGHGRLTAMKKLGWTDCDVIELDIDDLQATALGIALNRTAELATWNPEILTKLLSELRQQDALDGVGYTASDIDALLAEVVEPPKPQEIDDPGPEEPPEHPVSRLGDLWILGEHRLLNGDSTRAEDVARLLDGKTAALLATDPPYCVDYTGADRPGDSGKDWSHLYNEVDIKDLGQFLDAVLNACLPYVELDAGIYIWHAHVQQPVIAATFERHELLLHQILVWNKPAATFGHSYYRWKHEPCAFGWRRGHKPAHGPGLLDSVWDVDWDGKARITSFHPTSKPTRLFEIPMEQHTKPGALVLEPFSGSGSQIIAAEKLSRRCYAIELQPAFVDGTIARWEKATGKRAVLAGDGRTFAEIAAGRG